jgi:hypothetical protein
MPDTNAESAFVYRRVSPPQFDSKAQRIKPDVFALRPNEEGLSVFDARIVGPRGALQAFLDFYQNNLDAEDELLRDTARKRLEQYPDVETMVAKGWRVVQLAVAEVTQRGFSLTEPETDGHCEIRGERERFSVCQLEFVQLVADGVAPLLTETECLAK